MKPTPDSPEGTGVNLDLRDLPPPEPLHRALEAAERLAAGESVTVLTRFRPAFLIDQLEARGLAYACVSLGELSWQTSISREAATPTPDQS